VVYRSGQRVKRTMAAAISPEGDLYFETFEGGITAERYKSFLEHLSDQEGGITFVIHDGLPPHKSKLVQEYVESTKGKVRTFQLPGYSPELNPEEWVWERLKREIGKRAHKSIEDLTDHAVEIMNKILAIKNFICKSNRAVFPLPFPPVIAIKFLFSEIPSSLIVSSLLILEFLISIESNV